MASRSRAVCGGDADHEGDPEILLHVRIPLNCDVGSHLGLWRTGATGSAKSRCGLASDSMLRCAPKKSIKKRRANRLQATGKFSPQVVADEKAIIARDVGTERSSARLLSTIIGGRAWI
jgi:hypothetical protein